jgi:hypothetical protein
MAYRRLLPFTVKWVVGTLLSFDKYYDIFLAVQKAASGHANKHSRGSYFGYGN